MANQRQDVTDPAEALALAVHELLRRVRFDDVGTVCRWGLTRTECHVLEVVSLDGPLTVNDIAGRIRLNKSTASRVVQSLAAKKLLLRRSAAHDGRVLSVAATRKGTALWKTIVRASADAYRDILAGASAAERKIFTNLLQRIADVATADRRFS